MINNKKIIEIVVGITVLILIGFFFYKFEKSSMINISSNLDKNVFVNSTGDVKYYYKTEYGVNSTSTSPIISYGKKDIEEKINTGIKDNFYQMKCDAESKKDPGSMTDDFATSTVVYNQNGILSIEINYDYYCGGAYPNHGVSYLNYDLKTGEKIAFSNLFVDFDKNHDKILEIETNKLNYMLKNNLITMSDECDNGQASVDDVEYTFNVENQTLDITPNLPHVIQACTVTIPLTQKDVGKFISSNGILTRFFNQTQK